MEKLNRLRAWLQGNKTYLGLGTLCLIGILWKANLIDPDTAEAIGGIVALLTGVTFKAGQNRIETTMTKVLEETKK